MQFECLEERFMNTIKYFNKMQNKKVMETKTSKLIILSSVFQYSFNLYAIKYFNKIQNIKVMETEMSK